MYNTNEGENFIPPGLADANNTGTPAFNSSVESFENWLSGYMPGLSAGDLDEVKTLYPQAGSSEAIVSYNDSYTRAALIFRDSVLACPGYWMAGAAPRGGYLGEYSISPAKHGSDTIYVRLPFSFYLLHEWSYTMKREWKIYRGGHIIDDSLEKDNMCVQGC